jgi:hypothetical protein
MSLQESPKQKNISKSRKGHPKVTMPKLTVARTKSTAAKEPSQPREKYTKQIKYFNEFRAH